MKVPVQTALRVEDWSRVAGDAIRPRHESGAVYTPRVLADWLATILLSELRDDRSVVWDLACGEGALLAAVDRAAPGRHELVGIDIDADALATAARNVPHARIVHGDALHLIDTTSVSNLCVSSNPPDAIILNPPWGASMGYSTRQLQDWGYELARGQFDSYDLFVELSLTLLRPAGVAALILPDSLLNPEHLRTRRLLLERTHMMLVARLGEGFFTSVYRGTLVIMFRNRLPREREMTRCIRLTKETRDSVLRGSERLELAAQRNVHVVAQARFRQTPQLRIDIDVRETNARMIERIDACRPIVWREWFRSSRGVELSKHGSIVRCPWCRFARPTPRGSSDVVVTCRGCGEASPLDAWEHTTIVTQLDETVVAGRYEPLIVGEDVKRYQTQPSRKLLMGIPGINYKSPSLFEPPKLLIRKTGVGLNAAIDRSGARTTQVVFLYTPLPQAPDFMLDYVTGVLNSRVVLAYYLCTRGDLEWRSHPYVTQRVVEELPIPAVAPGTWRWEQAQAIAEGARVHAERRSQSNEADLLVEQLVMGLFELDATDAASVNETLWEAQALEGIRELRLPKEHALSPTRLNG